MASMRVDPDYYIVIRPSPCAIVPPFFEKPKHVRRDVARDATLEAVPNSPEEFAAFQQREIAKWGKVIRDAHIIAQ